MDDLISRQAAIEAVTAWLNKAINPINQSKYNDGEIDAYETALSELKKIPSAQPEIIRCKDCKNGDWYKYNDGTMFCYCMEHEHGGFTENDYCSRGERIE